MISRTSSKHLLRLTVALAGALLATTAHAADPGKIVVQVDKPGAKISPTFYGLMTEEINYSYEGGIYGELLPNRDFKGTGGAGGGGGRRGAPQAQPASADSTPIQGAAHWSLIQTSGKGTAALDNNDAIPNTVLNTCLKLEVADVPAGGRVGIANDGFWGVPAKPNATYTASFYAKGGNGFTGPLTIDLESNDGKTVHAKATVDKISDKWERYVVTMKTGQLELSATNRLVVSAAGKGTISFDQVSLFPPVFKERAGTALGERPVTGFRPDILQLLDDMRPTFLRFPGGNYVEGPNFNARFNFKTTIGPWEQRPGKEGSWGYRSSDGMGLMEFLEWCEDIKMEPVLAVWDGLDLNRAVVTGDALKPYIQDALDEIEYVSGDATTTWGAKRAKDGHPEPFKLNFVEIGNEDNLSNGAATYRGATGRFALFYEAIKAKYPKIQVIATTNPNSTHDVIDDHYYMDYAGAMRNAHQYDPNRHPRTANGQPAPKVFVGEWATRDNNNAIPTSTFHAALSDAAFLTGLERNADIVVMSCYAPLFVNVNPGGQQWATDLIGYNTIKSFGSSSYYVQKMFNNNKGDVVLPVTLTPQIAPAAANPAPGGRGGGGPTDSIFVCSSRDEATGDIILKVVNAVETPQQMEISLEGATTIGKTAKIEVLTAGLTDVNTIAEPMKVAPKSSTIDAGAKFVHEFAGHAVTVIRFTTK